MAIEWDVPIEMDDGVMLRADLFRPAGEARVPVLVSHGPYAKGLAFQDGYPMQWSLMAEFYPDALAGSTNTFQSWEVVDPEQWVPAGYAVLRVDSRGAGRSPGYLDCYSRRETRDFYDCIEWAGTQPWSNGKVGLSGISYYAINQWQVAGLRPPHLSAICPWEGAIDWYRDVCYHGGIHCVFLGRWYEKQVESVQFGAGERGGRSTFNGLAITGDLTLTDDELAANRADMASDVLDHPLDDSYHRERSGDPSKIDVPLLSCANWGGQALHSRGNFIGFTDSASTEKWLEVHGGEHWTLYYTEYGRTLQRRFFDHFLKGVGDWDTQPRVSIDVRHADGSFSRRAEEEWPLSRTQWTKAFLDPSSRALTFDPPEAESAASYRGFGDGLTLSLPPISEDIEVTGPLAAKLWISSTTVDADLFLVVRVFDSHDHEVLFSGAIEPQQPVSQGWLRASQRKLDLERSRPWRPSHVHRVSEQLEPGEVYEVDVEIWPTCVVIPAGYRLALTILGHDFDHGKEGRPSHLGLEMRGSGFWHHTDDSRRPADVFDGEVTVYGGGTRPSCLLLPIVPPG
jgi:predicted acyl esterase